MSEPNSRRRDASDRDKQEKFDLSPSIFLPFSSFPQDIKTPSTYLEPTLKLQQIIQNVSTHQEQVRKNMVFLVQQRADRLTSIAKSQISALSDEEEDENWQEKIAVKKSVDKLFEGLRKEAKQGSKGEEFEFVFEREMGGGEEDVEMGNTDTNTEFRPRITRRSPPPEASSSSSHQIRATLSTDLKNLVDQASEEMTAYDVEAKKVLAYYQAALDRRTGRTGNSSASGSGAKPIVSFALGAKGGNGGALGAKGGPEGGQDDVRRMSNGMLVPGMGGLVSSKKAQPVRVTETMEEVARRGSR